MNLKPGLRWSGHPGAGWAAGRAVVLLVWAALVGCLGWMGGCGGPAGGPEGSDGIGQGAETWEDQVTVVSYPMYEALESLVGDRVALFHPRVAEGQAMERSMVRRVQASRLIILDGTHHVGWVDTVSLPESRKRLSTFDVFDQLILVEDLGSHSHGPGLEHSHSGLVAQTWLDPALFRQQIETALRDMASVGLLSEDDLADLVARWWEQVREIEGEIERLRELGPREAIADKAGAEYLFRRLGWSVEIQDLELAAAQDPGRLRQELESWLVERSGGMIVLTGEPIPALGEVLERLEAPILRLDLLNEMESGRDYGTRMRRNLEKIQELARSGF